MNSPEAEKEYAKAKTPQRKAQWPITVELSHSFSDSQPTQTFSCQLKVDFAHSKTDTVAYNLKNTTEIRRKFCDAMVISPSAADEG